MLFLAFGFLLLLALILLLRGFINADPARLGRFVRWFLLAFGAALAVVVLVLLVFSDRLAPALGVAAFLASGLLRGRGMLRRWWMASGPSPGKTSEVETEFLRMRLDHDTGAMSGTVRRGPYAGRRLDELDEGELFELWRDCRIGDDASARLIEAYLDRLRPDWRAAADATTTAGAGTRAASGDAMTREEAYAILGLAAGAEAAAIKDAHRKLMMKLHPDQGGSTYLAAKINRAKEVLLG